MPMVAANDRGAFYPDMLNQPFPLLGGESDAYVRKLETTLFDSTLRQMENRINKSYWLDFWRPAEGLFLGYSMSPNARRVAGPPAHPVRVRQRISLPGMGPALADRCYMRFEAAGHVWQSLSEFPAPALAADHWPAFAALLSSIAAPEGPWQGQVSRVREWYEPHLDRIHEDSETRRATPSCGASPGAITEMGPAVSPRSATATSTWS